MYFPSWKDLYIPFRDILTNSFVKNGYKYVNQICNIQNKSLYYFIRGSIMNRPTQTTNNSSRFPRDWMNIISRELGEVARELAEGVQVIPSTNSSLPPPPPSPPHLPEYQNTYYSAPPFTASEPSVPLYSSPGTSSGPSPVPSPGPITNTGPSTSPATRTQHIIDLDEMIYRYSENMRQYSHTMREMVQLVSQLTAPNRVIEELSQAPAPAPVHLPAQMPANDTTVDYTTIFSYLLYPATNTMNTSTNTTFLTREQILAATRTYGYVAPENPAIEPALVDDASTNVLPESLARCPITLDVFQPGDVLCEIRGCRHVFKRPALINWLRRNSHCPVCRYNLFDYPANELNNLSSPFEEN
jgi:hypothetical protein